MPAGTSYLVKEGMIGKTVCRETYNADAYYKFTVKNNFLHAIHPVGWFRKTDIELDGKAWDTKDSYFVLRGQFFRIPDMHTISEVYWNLCEPAEIYLKQDRELEKGTHEITVTFTTSLLEDTQILDRERKYSDRVEFAQSTIELV